MAMPPKTRSRSAQVTYAHTHMLPIWERWTDGNLAMRRALECKSADPASHEERYNILFEAQCRFQGRGDSPANVAAMVAAQACQYALLNYPIEMVRQIGAVAEDHHAKALAEAKQLATQAASRVQFYKVAGRCGDGFLATSVSREPQTA